MNFKLKTHKFKILKANSLKLKAQKGQIMIEAMIAITIAVVGLLGIFSLLSNSLSLNRVVADQVIGTNLSAEGIELVKNLIDTNLIQRRPWNSGIGDGQFEIDFNDADLDTDQNRFIYFDFDSGQYSYDLGESTKFKRLITIGAISPDEIKVNSLVVWETRGGGSFEVNLEDHFFNWR